MASVCSDCVPPMTAASAWMATRTRLTSGCCSVSETPAVWVWKRISHERGFFAPKRSRICRAQMRRAGAELGDLFEEVVVAVEEEADARRERVDVQPARERPFHVLDAVGERERQLLGGRRAGLADVVAADAHRVPERHLLRRELDRVGHQPHRVRAGE